MILDKEECYGLSNMKEQKKDDIVMIFPEIKNLDHECLLEQNHKWRLSLNHIWE